MPRAPLFRTEDFAYHVLSRTNNREWFYLPQPMAWRIFSAQLSDSAHRYRVIVHAFVLMTNHFHLIVSTPDKNLDAFMRHLLTQVSRGFQIRSGRENHLFGGRHHRSVLEHAESLAFAFKYLYRNPVRAGITARVEDYAFSSLSTEMEGSQIPVAEGFDSYWSLIPRTHSERLIWLNIPTPREAEDLVTRALRRHHFKFTTSSNEQARLRVLRAAYAIGNR